MKLNDFPYPKLNLPKELRDSPQNSEGEILHALQNYINLVDKYIYTDIDLDRDQDDPLRTHAWILKVVSANVLRSLYLRNSVVDAMNSRNSVALFLPLKAWFEVVGALAAILDLLQKQLPPEELSEKFLPYALGNKGKGNLRVGTVEAKSVATMIEKADKYMKKMVAKQPQEVKDNYSNSKYFTDFYDMASNPSHPSFEAYELVGGLGDDNFWRAKHPDETKQLIIDYLPAFGGLLMSPLCIQLICQEIFSIEKENFSALGASEYFKE